MWPAPISRNSTGTFNVKNTYIPARHAGFYGLKTGQKFISKITAQPAK
jgi:hypothetical protein